MPADPEVVHKCFFNREVLLAQRAGFQHPIARRGPFLNVLARQRGFSVSVTSQECYYSKKLYQNIQGQLKCSGTQL